MEKQIQETKVVTGSGTSRFPRFRPSRKQTLVVSLLVAILVLAGACFWYFTTTKTTKKPSTPTPQAAAKTLIDQSKERKSTTAPSPQEVAAQKQQQYTAVKNQISTEEQKNSDPKTLGPLYIQAALLGANKKDPQAKVYAQKALDAFPKDAETQTYYKGYIYVLTKIASGDYSVVPK